jgi:hypothetical protein
LVLTGCATRDAVTKSDIREKNPASWIEKQIDNNLRELTGKTRREIIPAYKPVSDIIASKGVATPEELAGFLLHYNPALDRDWALELASAYVREGAIEGINSDAAFMQMCLETGYLRYQGSILTPDQNNFCGLGSVNSRTKGHAFPTMEEGVLAHIQHLKAYGSTEPLVRECIDPRFSLVKRGSAPTVNELTGLWANDPGYGYKLEDLLTRLDAHVFKSRDTALAMLAD